MEDIRSGRHQGFAGNDMEFEQALRNPFVQRESRKLFEGLDIKPKKPIIVGTDNPKNNWLESFYKNK